MYRPGDRQLLVGAMKVLEDGKTHWQIGDNTNLFDITYVDNIVHAHLLAADKLVPPTPYDPAEVREELDTPLAYVDLTTGKRRVSTSSTRPLGPYVERQLNADELEVNSTAPPLHAVRPAARVSFP